MDNKLKNALAGVAIIFMLVIGFSFFYYSWSYAKSIQPSSYRTFSVTGEGKMTAAPDLAEFTYSVITEGGKDLGALQTQNNQKSEQVINYLKKQGVEAKDIKTVALNVEPRYQYYNCTEGSCPPATIIGYTVRQTVSVKVRDLAKAGALLSGVVSNGANSVSNLNFTLENRDKVVNDAKAQAINKAKEKAETLAKAGGFRLGKLIAIDDGFAPYAPTAVAEGRGGMAMGKAMDSVTNQAAPIEPGSQEIQQFVTLRYEIR